MRIGFIGLGNMGGPMALNVLKGGHAMVVTDIRHELAKPHLAQGARWADTPKAVAQASEVVFTSLPGPREVESVVLGANGILEGAAKGTLYVDLSTNSATLIRKIHGICAERGVDVLDAPVSGGVPGARSGKLAVLVGGDEALYAASSPCSTPSATGHLGRRDRLRHGREARAQHGVGRLAHVYRRGHDPGVKAGVAPECCSTPSKSSFGQGRVLGT
jgi:3-hydroxyisobutyrate dehydrogenase-like beta-hydroxyacid dehydrogenase